MLFLGLVDHYWQFIKGFTLIAQPLNKHLVGEGVSRKTEQVSLSEIPLEAFQALKQACMSGPSLPSQTTLKIFYSKQMLLRKDWEWYFPKNNQMGDTTQLPMVAEPLLLMKRTIILQNLNS